MVIRLIIMLRHRSTPLLQLLRLLQQRVDLLVEVVVDQLVQVMVHLLVVDRKIFLPIGKPNL